MSDRDLTPDGDRPDEAPGADAREDHDWVASLRLYIVGLVAAAALTGASFWVVGGSLVYGPGVPMALVALAIAQMGVHLVFFLHLSTGPDNTNNALALAFGVLIVFLVLVGTIWIMANLQHNMVTMDALMRAQR